MGLGEIMRQWFESKTLKSETEAVREQHAAEMAASDSNYRDVEAAHAEDAGHVRRLEFQAEQRRFQQRERGRL